MSLEDKNVVVTGGSRGLGLGLVEALVAHGARVTVVARGADALESVRARLGVATISADVTDETATHVRRDKAAPFQWVQAPPGDRSSRKRPEQAWRRRKSLLARLQWLAVRQGDLRRRELHGVDRGATGRSLSRCWP